MHTPKSIQTEESVRDYLYDCRSQMGFPPNVDLTAFYLPLLRSVDMSVYYEDIIAEIKSQMAD